MSFARLPKIIDNALKGARMVSAATLTKKGAPAGDGRGGRTRATGDEHSCRALVTDYSDAMRAFSNGAIQVRDRKAIITGASLPADVKPETGDALEIEGETWSVIAAKRDPAAATYEVQVRPAA